MLKPKPALFILQLSCLRILSVLWLMWHFQPKQPPRRAVRLCCVRTGERECIRECAYVYVWAREWELCVQCRNVAGHRQLWNFPIKSQYVSIGCLGFVGWLVFFFLSVALQFHFHLWAQRERGTGWEMLTGPPKPPEEPSSSHDRWSTPPRRWARFPGRGARGQGEGKPSLSGQLRLKGPLQSAAAAARSLTFIFWKDWRNY